METGKRMHLKPGRIRVISRSVLKSAEDIEKSINRTFNVEDIKKAFAEHPHIGMGDYAWENLKKKGFEIIEQEDDLYFVILSVCQLGFKKGANYGNVVKTAFAKGFSYIPKEYVYGLRLFYSYQPAGETLYPVMEPIKTEGNPLVFRLYHHALVRTDKDGKERKNILLLNGNPLKEDHFCQPEDMFAFQAWKPENA